MCVPLRGGRKIVLVQEGVEGVCVLYASVGVVWYLVSILIDFVHEAVPPFIVSECSWQFFREPGQLPVEIAFLPHVVDILRNHPIEAFVVQLLFSNIRQPFGKAKT